MVKRQYNPKNESWVAQVIVVCLTYSKCVYVLYMYICILVHLVTWKHMELDFGVGTPSTISNQILIYFDLSDINYSMAVGAR